MQEKPTERIRGVFGWNGFPDALFYEANYALRFDLCGELPSHPLRFLRAMDRAREVASAIFEQSLNLTAIVCYYDGERRSSRPASSFKTLADIGFQAEFRKPERIPLNDQDYIAEFGEDLCAYWCSAEMGRSREDRDALLWAGVTDHHDAFPSLAEQTPWTIVHRSGDTYARQPAPWHQYRHCGKQSHGDGRDLTSLHRPRDRERENSMERINCAPRVKAHWTFGDLPVSETMVRAYPHHGHGPGGDQRRRIHMSAIRGQARLPFAASS